MNNWLDLSKQQQIDLFNQIGATTGLPAYAVEKDAWVTLILRMLFNSEIADQLIFKGGTSLSKAYDLIKRLSEDIDLAIKREYFGYGGYLSKGQIRKLRRKSHDFSHTILPDILVKQLQQYGIKDNFYELEIPNKEISDQDPEIVHVNYTSVFETESYLPNRVRIEIGARSLIEPFESRKINSFIDQNFQDAEFSEKEFQVNTVKPQKTFLEKLILLHEEFQKSKEKIRSDRMSRHLYDIYKIAHTQYGTEALNDKNLFKNIINHREKFTPIRNVNYKKIKLNALNFLPPTKFEDLYRQDYREMQTNMIYGDNPDFKSLINRLKKLI